MAERSAYEIANEALNAVNNLMQPIVTLSMDIGEAGASREVWDRAEGIQALAEKAGRIAAEALRQLSNGGAS